MLRIESKEAVIEFELKSAQMISFKLKDRDFEYLWQPKEGFWQGRNPILFPLVGSTYDKKLHIDDEEYAIGNHGFCRNMDFNVIDQKEHQITFELCDSSETLAMYPYAFSLQVTYTLIAKEVTISYVITNKNQKMMPFTFGLHPAFTCPLSKENTIEDTYLVFSNEDKEYCTNEVTWHDEKSIQLSEVLFEQVQTLIFENHQSSFVTMTNHQHGVKVTSVGYRWLAFWKQPQAPFVCIEPWHGRSDSNDSIKEFKDREGMIHLEANKSYTTQYKIAIF